jgi:hypothetical protein
MVYHRFSYLHLFLYIIIFSNSPLFIFLTDVFPTFVMLESQSDSRSEHEHLDQTHSSALIIPDLSGAVPTSVEARAKRRIAALEEELHTMQQEKGKKQRFVVYHLPYCVFLIVFKRKTTYYFAQGRAIRRMTVLYTSVEDLIAENDRRCEQGFVDGSVERTTIE